MSVALVAGRVLVGPAPPPDAQIFSWRDADGRLAAPFSCYPPFRGEMPFVVARGRIVLSDETLRLFQDLAGGGDLETLLADAIRRKLPTSSNGGDLLIDAADLPGNGTPARQSGTES